MYILHRQGGRQTIPSTNHDMQNSELTNGSLGLPIEILEDIIARILGSHLEARAFGRTSPSAPITVLDHEHLIPCQERSHAYMLIATVCRLWHELAGAEFYRSCEVPGTFRLASRLQSLIVNRHRIYRLKVSRIGSLYQAREEHRQITLILEAIGAPIGKTILLTSATLPNNLRELIITHSRSIRWRSVIEAIASLNNLEILGLHNLGFLVHESLEDTVVLPPRLTTLDVRLYEFDFVAQSGTPFYYTFMDTLSIINLRFHTQNTVNRRDALIQVLEALGKRLVHLDVDLGFRQDPAIHSPFILPKLRYLDLKFPIEQSTLSIFARSANIETLTINSLNYLWEWTDDLGDLLAGEFSRYNVSQELENVFKMITIAFLGPTINSLEQVIMGDLHRHPEAPIQDVEKWTQFEMVVSKWTKRFKEKGITVLAQYDRFQTPRPIIPYVECLILEETRKMT